MTSRTVGSAGYALRVVLAMSAVAGASLGGVRVAAAEVTEWVKLKDGSILQGTLVEYAPNDHITVQLATGEVRRVAWSDVADSSSGMGPATTSSGAPGSGPPGSTAPAPTAWVPPAATGPLPAPSDAPPKVSHVGAWLVDLRIPFGVMLASPGPIVNTFGIEIGLLKRLTRRLSLGGFVAYDGMWNVSGDLSNSDGLLGLARAGVDLHYTLGHGTAEMSTDGDVTWSQVPSTYWIGVRGGPETTSLSSVSGGFAELDLGWDARLGDARAQFGMVVSAGLSFEPTGQLGTGMSNFNSNTGMPEATGNVNPYFLLSIHFVIGG